MPVVAVMQGRHEVDFVVEAGRETLAIEVKGASRWSGQDLSGLNALLDKAPRCRAAILAYGNLRTETGTMHAAGEISSVVLSGSNQSRNQGADLDSGCSNTKVIHDWSSFHGVPVGTRPLPTQTAGASSIC